MLSAHAALGHEWDLVVIAGLQDGLWPNTIPRGGVLGTQRLLDALDGVTEDASVRAPLLAEERRLLVAAMGRARRRLLVTAVDSDTGGAGEEAALPSPFFFELAAWDTDAGDPEPLAPISAPRVLSAAALVGRLRGVVCAPDGAVEDIDEPPAVVRQRNWPDWRTPMCRAPTRPAGTDSRRSAPTIHFAAQPMSSP